MAHRRKSKAEKLIRAEKRAFRRHLMHKNRLRRRETKEQARLARQTVFVVVEEPTDVPTAAAVTDEVSDVDGGKEIETASESDEPASDSEDAPEE